MIGSIHAKQAALEELVDLADVLGPIARRIESSYRDSGIAFILGRAEGRLRIIASTLGAKSVEPRPAPESAFELNPLGALEEAHAFLAELEDNGLVARAAPLRRRLKEITEAFGLKGGSNA